MNNRTLNRKAVGWLWAACLAFASPSALCAGPPGQVDQAWRDRVAIGYFNEAARDMGAAQRAAAAELEAARGRGELRAELRAAARYLMVGELQHLDCEWIAGYLTRAQAGGSSFQGELFDIAVLAHLRRASPCKHWTSMAEIQALAETLGDPARLYFVRMARVNESITAGAYDDALANGIAASKLAISEAQRIDAILAIGHSNWLGNYTEADNISALEAALADLSGTEFARLRVDVQALLYRITLPKGDVKTALKYAQDALPELRRGVSGIDKAEYHLTNFARVFNTLKRPEDALRLLDESRQLQTHNILNAAFRANGTLASLLIIGTPEAYQRGLAEIKDVRQITADPDAIVPRARKLVESSISRFYEKFAHYEEALDALKRASLADDKAQKISSERIRLELQQKLNLAAKDKENAQLKADAELQAARQRGWIAAFAVAAVGVAAAGTALAVAVRRGRRLAEVSGELAQRNGELEQRSASRIRLLAAACHDLRQPAHALGLLAELGSDAQQEPRRFVAWLQSVRRSTASLGDMLDELMDLGRLDGGHYAPQVTDVPVAELMQEVMLHFGGLAARKGLVLEVPPTEAVVVSDRHLLRRIVFNLVSNGIKYTDSGFVRVSLRPEGDTLHLSVQDSGPGIPPDKLDEVFRDYVRLNPTQAAEGLGIGLSIVRRAAELLGHGLTLHSPPGQGTTVSLHMALSHRSPPLVAASLAGEVAPASRGLLVLMENDSDVREAMAALLQRWGYTVHAGPSAAAVLGPLQAGQVTPDLVITDLHLDGRNGLAEVAILRSTLQLPALPALLVTGDLDAAIASEAAQAQVYVAHKPLAPRKLAAMVQELVPEAGRTAGAQSVQSASPGAMHHQD